MIKLITEKIDIRAVGWIGLPLARGRTELSAAKVSPVVREPVSIRRSSYHPTFTVMLVTRSPSAMEMVAPV